jgi:hypothetical protein
VADQLVGQPLEGVTDPERRVRRIDLSNKGCGPSVVDGSDPDGALLEVAEHEHAGLTVVPCQS